MDYKTAWEYETIPTRNDMESLLKRLNELGLEGWEAWAIEGMYVFLKREQKYSDEFYDA